MVLDMEGEFYKLARGILSNPRMVYKMLAIDPHSGRLAIMGSEGAMASGRSIMEYFATGPEKRAYKYGKATARDLYGGILKEFDEEIENLDPKKLMELGLAFGKSLGWGAFTIENINKKKARVEITARDTIELDIGNADHNMLTCGFLSGICQLAFKRGMRGMVANTGKEMVTFSFKPNKAVR